jgi:hypothetical protein
LGFIILGIIIGSKGWKLVSNVTIVSLQLTGIVLPAVISLLL